MTTILARIFAALLFLCLQSALAIADTAAGLAAYDKGDYATALKLLRPEAEKGDAAAQVKYGLIFAKALGVEHDPAEAFKWFQKSAAAGNAEAMYCLGVAYDIGDAGTKDPEKALEWYRKSAEKGYAKAQFNLGQMLQSGDGVPADPVASVAWLEKAAAQNDGDAETALSYAYYKGLGVEPNLLSMRYWVERAAAHGSAKGQKLAAALREDFAEIERGGVPRTSGGDGASFDRGIVLPDARIETKGVAAEYQVLRYFFRGWRKVSQALASAPDQRPFDIITLEKAGKQRDVYFDISNFFGHME